MVSLNRSGVALLPGAELRTEFLGAQLNIVSLEEAVKEIARTSQRASVRKDALPYVCIVGAGISYPSVPLADEIRKHCEEEASRFRIVESPKKTSAMEQYSYWFMKAYPSAIEQQKYLQSLIEDKPITPANFRLAHLLLKSEVARILITPNFDDFASKAITVFGHGGIRFCDHPETVERVGPEEGEIQIVHVHGTYRYYDLANLKAQIESRAEVSRSTSFTMLGLLDRMLVNRSPLIVGYSGWDGDVIMTALHRRLGKRLRYRMFWFCYREDSTDSLPEWLKQHEDVVFVKPAGLVRDVHTIQTGKENLATSIGSKDKPTLESIPSEGANKLTLLAQDVFDSLIRVVLCT